jgi:MerR family transcriptional regulator, thiopeptide resistance regulator
LNGRLYQANEFAMRAGITVRTLHHYDHMALLKPTSRSDAGYRLYSDRDLARLQQIVTLKFLGFSLAQIQRILDRPNFDLVQELRAQRSIIAEKRRQLDSAITAIERAERALSAKREPDWELFRKIIEVIEMQNNMEWTNKYYSEEAKAELSKRREQDPEIARRGERDWAVLIKEVEAVLGEDPASPKVQALAERWQNLIASFTAGNQQVGEGLKKLYADQKNWPSTFKKPYSDEVGALMCKAMEVRKQRTK